MAENIQKILIVDDHPYSINALRLVLKNEWPDTEIIEARNGKEAVTQYEEHLPDVVLMDFSMPGMNGIQVSENMFKRHKHVPIILLTLYDSIIIALNFIIIGGKGFVTKSGELNEIGDAIYAVTRGDYYFHSRHEQEILNHLENGIDQNLPTLKFTRRELEVVIKTSRGMTIREISESMNLSERTVETYRYDLLKKVQVKNAMELVGYFYRNGLIWGDDYLQ